MARSLISVRQLAHARHHGNRLLNQTCDIYRPDANGVMSPAPVHPGVACSVDMVNRLANAGGVSATQGMPPETPIRFDIRFDVHQDVRPRDMVRIRTDALDPTWIDQEFTIVGVRTPAEYPLFAFADAQEGA